MVSNALGGFLKGFADQAVKEDDEKRKLEAAREERIAAEKRSMGQFRQKLEMQDAVYTQRDKRKKEAAQRLTAAQSKFYSRAAAGEDIDTIMQDAGSYTYTDESGSDVDFPVPIDSGKLINLRKQAKEDRKRPEDVEMDEIISGFNRFKITNPNDPTTLSDFARMRRGDEPVPIDSNKETDKALQKQIRSFSSVNRGLSELSELAEFAGYGQSGRADISGKARQLGKIAGDLTGLESMRGVGEDFGRFIEPDAQREGFSKYTAQKNIMIGRINDTVAMLGRLSDFDAKTILTALEGVEGATDPMSIKAALSQIQKELRLGASEALKALETGSVTDTVSKDDYNMLRALAGGTIFEGSDQEKKKQYDALPAGAEFYHEKLGRWVKKPQAKAK